ncbi:hypothetical protein C8Q73DRAFT_696060 [Cubamyces lactineus]|nr:hypothetical protein C8Q73DRAFT_696060 [Cubamyces lactineus]
MSVHRRRSLPRLSIPPVRESRGRMDRDRTAYNQYPDFQFSAAEHLTALEGLPSLAVPQVHYQPDIYTACDLIDAHLIHGPPAMHASPRSSHNEIPQQRFLKPIPLPSVSSHPTEDTVQPAGDRDDEPDLLLRCEDLLPGAHTMFHEHLRATVDVCSLPNSGSPLSPRASSFVTRPVADQSALGLVLPNAINTLPPSHPPPPTPVLRPLPPSLLPPVPLDLSPLPQAVDLPRYERVQFEYASTSGSASGAAFIPRNMGTGPVYPGRSARQSRASSSEVSSGRAPAVPCFAQLPRRERGTSRGDRR